MLGPAVLVAASLLAALLSVAWFGSVLSTPLLLALLCAVAAFVLLARAALASALRRPSAAYVVVDGSNVMHWQEGPPSLAAVGRVVGDLSARGYVPVVWFDANVGYRIGDRYLRPEALARHLGLAKRQVHIAPKGTPADPLLLEGATRLSAPVVSHDRFRTWADRFPAVITEDRLIPGRIVAGEIRLRIDTKGRGSSRAP